MKLSINLEDELVHEMDAFADENYMTRSGLIKAAVVNYLNSRAMSKALIDLSENVARIAEREDIEEADIKNLVALGNVLKVAQSNSLVM